ncbi:MAG: isoamylase early set domain-containing protein [Candidatus Promineifilaceae bacterium]
MLTKSYSKTGQTCRVTFRLPAEVEAETAALCGEFNDWDPAATPMKQLKNGSFSATVSLAPGQTYRYRFLLDNERWENDWEAEAYAPNDQGSEDSLVTV